MKKSSDNYDTDEKLIRLMKISGTITGGGIPIFMASQLSIMIRNQYAYGDWNHDQSKLPLVMVASLIPFVCTKMLKSSEEGKADKDKKMHTGPSQQESTDGPISNYPRQENKKPISYNKIWNSALLESYAAALKVILLAVASCYIVQQQRNLEPVKRVLGL